MKKPIFWRAPPWEQKLRGVRRSLAKRPPQGSHSITDAFHFRQLAFLPWLRLLHTCMRHFAYVRSPYDPQNDKSSTRDWTKQPYQNDIALLRELRFCIDKLQPLKKQHQLLPWTTLKPLGLAPYCCPSCTELHRLLLLFPWPDWLLYGRAILLGTPFPFSVAISGAENVTTPKIAASMTPMMRIFSSLVFLD
jgi:hypothetical protein